MSEIKAKITEALSNMPKVTMDDKSLVILCVTFLTFTAMFQLADPVQIVRDAYIGLFGVAVGRSLDKE